MGSRIGCSIHGRMLYDASYRLLPFLQWARTFRCKPFGYAYVLESQVTQCKPPGVTNSRRRFEHAESTHDGVDTYARCYRLLRHSRMIARCPAAELNRQGTTRNAAQLERPNKSPADPKDQRTREAQ